MTDQRTLSGAIADGGRKRPETMLWCARCCEWVLRSKRHSHPHDLEDKQPTEDDERLPEYCQFDTQTFKVSYHMEVIEVVEVEARSKADAKEQASHIRTYDGEYMDTMHTEKRPLGDLSSVSWEYLENNNLLPDGFERPKTASD